MSFLVFILDTCTIQMLQAGMLVVASRAEKGEAIHSENPAGFSEWITRLTIKLDRLIVLSNSSLLGWFLHVSLIVIIKGRSPKEVSLIVIIKQV